MYTLRVAFTTSHGRRLSSEEAFLVHGTLTSTLTTQNDHHVLTTNGFESEESARSYLSRLESAFAWTLLARDLPTSVNLTPQRIAYAEDPYEAAKNLAKSLGVTAEGPVDGIIDGLEPAIYPTEKKLRVLTFGAGSAFVTAPSNQILEELVKGASLPGSERLPAQPKIQVALKLYAAFFYEASPAARFLTLIMALEALAEPTTKSPGALALMAKWSAELAKAREAVDLDSDDDISLEALARELLFRQEDSLSAQLRRTVVSSLSGDQDAAQQGRNAIRLYALRSKLVHDGSLPPNIVGPAIEEAKQIVQRVLQRRLSRVINASE